MTGHPTGMLQALALGELDRDDARSVMEHADTCPTCAEELADAMRGVAALTSLGDASWTTASRSLATKRDPRWLVGALAAAAIALGIWNADMQLTSATVPVDALVHSHFTHHPLVGAGGQAKLIQALDGSWVYVVATGLRPLRSYDVHVNETTIGSLRADLSGNATGYWRRSPGKIASASLVGQGATLRWDGR